MTYKILHREIIQLLKNAGIESFAFDASELWRSVGIDRSSLLLHGDKAVDAEIESRLISLATQRASHIPLQYLLGEWEFYGIPLAVGTGVLIPRADTETIVDCCLDILKNVPNPKIADLCSGSGAIAIALHSLLKTADITALELSEEALVYLRKNTERHCADGRLHVVQGDALADPLPDSFDLVVSNPPYITANDMVSLSPEVCAEPKLALFGGDDGLQFYRSISENYFNSLKIGGALVFEIGYDQSETVPDIMASCGYENIGSRADLGGITRCVYGIKAK